MNSIPYHSALSNGSIENAPALNRYEAADGIAFTHDLFDPLPAEYETADCFYAEPPWPAGVKVFDERVGIAGRTFGDLMLKVAAIIESDSRPVMMPVGKTALRKLPSPDACHQVLLPSSKAHCLLASWNWEFTPQQTTIDSALELISAHSTVGDFACGYGHTAWLARSLGKRWIVSDYNASCIGFIASRLP
jgi:hypothetical protein